MHTNHVKKEVMQLSKHRQLLLCFLVESEVQFCNDSIRQERVMVIKAKGPGKRAASGRIDF